ncbi:MAG: excinuclease ABC subunit C [Bacteroidetes bacterium]|nr:excinuclease ABC subunit C [Bacteroidota bacterium]
MTIEEFKKVEPSIPDDPGIYIFNDEEDKVLYIGKAKNLRKRVSSYFTKQLSLPGKTKLLVKKTSRIESTIVPTEADALLLENTLIKEHQPKYNIQLKDDKSYPFICIKNERFPRIFLTRNVVEDGSIYLGPYTSVKKVRSILNIIRTIFPLRTCNYNLSKKNIEAGKFKVCLEYHIGNCLGPCEDLQTEKQYTYSIDHIKRILKGNTQVVINGIKQEMMKASEELRFEQANDLKDKLVLLQNYQSSTTVVNNKIKNLDVFSYDEEKNTAYVNYMKVNNGSIIQNKTIRLAKKLDESKEDLLLFAINDIRQQLKSDANELILPFYLDIPFKNITGFVPKRGDKKKLLDLSQMNLLHYRAQQAVLQRPSIQSRNARILTQLQKDLNLKELPVHIECFDNSNFQGSFPVASMVIFRNGKPSNKEYRHFNIKTVEGIDDFASMEEVVMRRYKKLMVEEESLPQLILIDGGKGQLSAAMKSIERLNIQEDIQVIAIAKRLEELFKPNDPIPLYLDKKSESLKLIQRLRNEAHRFAISFHRTKRSKATIKTELSIIDGIGDLTATKLLKHFKSVKTIKEASLKELISLIGAKKADLVSTYFSKDQ